MNREQIEHEPVLSGPVMEFLLPRAGETVLDATLGHGGHSLLLARAIGPGGRLIGLDVDPQNIERARARLEAAGVMNGGPKIHLFRANFREFEDVLAELDIPSVDIFFADLGVSTDQLMASELGLTFSEDAPLDMRLDDRLERTASDLVNALTENELSDILFFNSQERFSRRIAKRICQVRREGRIRRTSELVRIVCSALGVHGAGHHEKIHPATRTFMALRMAVNHETENLQALLAAAPKRLAAGGRIGVISFHSGEDRIVKQDFLARQRAGVYEIRTKKPVTPTPEELRGNPRSRSAKLRVAMRTAAGQGV